MKIFQGNTLPEPKSLMHATAEANNLVALTAAKNLYINRMEAVSNSVTPAPPIIDFWVSYIYETTCVCYVLLCYCILLVITL